MMVFFVGLILGVLITLAAASFTDTSPREGPLSRKCLSVDAELVYYDFTSFKCSNGAEFKRYDGEI